MSYRVIRYDSDKVMFTRETVLARRATIKAARNALAKARKGKHPVSISFYIVDDWGRKV